MYHGKRVVVVMPAYNAAPTLERTYREVMQQDYVDQVILVDDASSDETVRIAQSLENVRAHVHTVNLGYGGNQKTCYRLALEDGADIVVMVHPDYQYTPKLLPAMISLIGNGLYDCVVGSRILGGHALEGGMPWWRYVSNRFITFVENLLVREKLSEYHTGYRAFSSELLRKLPLDRNSNDFLFDNQMLLQVLWFGYKVAEITCPVKYFPEASSINLPRSIRYGVGCLWTATEYFLARRGLLRVSRFPRPVAEREKSVG